MSMGKRERVCVCVRESVSERGCVCVHVCIYLFITYKKCICEICLKRVAESEGEILI